MLKRDCIAPHENSYYRYLRYVGPNKSHGNIAELEFYNGTTRLNGQGFGSPGSWNNDPNYTFDKALDGNTNTSFDAPSADPGQFVGIDTVTPASAASTASSSDPSDSSS